MCLVVSDPRPSPLLASVFDDLEIDPRSLFATNTAHSGHLTLTGQLTTGDGSDSEGEDSSSSPAAVGLSLTAPSRGGSAGETKASLLLVHEGKQPNTPSSNNNSGSSGGGQLVRTQPTSPQPRGLSSAGGLASKS